MITTRPIHFNMKMTSDVRFCFGVKLLAGVFKRATKWTCTSLFLLDCAFLLLTACNHPSFGVFHLHDNLDTGNLFPRPGAASLPPRWSHRLPFRSTALTEVWKKFYYKDKNKNRMKKREREREYDLLWADLDLPPANPSSPPFPLTLGRNDNVSSFFLTLFYGAVSLYSLTV